jgi:hypothetical protein
MLNGFVNWSKSKLTYQPGMREEHRQQEYGKYHYVLAGNGKWVGCEGRRQRDENAERDQQEHNPLPSPNHAANGRTSTPFMQLFRQ